MLQYSFDDYLDLSNNEHYQLAQILDNITVDECDDDFNDFFSVSMEQ